MKKILSVVLALMMLLTMVSFASAETVEEIIAQAQTMTNEELYKKAIEEANGKSLLGIGNSSRGKTAKETFIELLKGIPIREDDLGNGALVGTAVGEQHPVAKKTPYFGQKRGFAIVTARHFVSHETGYSELLKLVEHGGLATPYAARHRHIERPADGITVS